MTELFIPEGFGEAKLIWDVTGRTNPITTTIGFTPNIGSTPDEAIESMWTNFAGTSGAPCAAAQMRSQFTFVGIQWLYNDAGVMIAGATTEAPVVGTADPATTVPVGETLLIQKRTARVGRRFRGRMYFPALQVTEGAVDHMGNLSSAAMSALHTIFDSTLANLPDDGTCTTVILHAGTGTLPAPTPITSFGIQSKMATQRRRLRA